MREAFQSLRSAKVQALRLAVHGEVRPATASGRLGQAEGTISKDVPEVLFVCVHNAGRSQMAAALLDRAAEGKVHVRSAGSAPASEIHAGVRAALAELGLDISREFPKPLTDEVVRAADVVITMGCGDACPVYPGKRYMDWDVPDPAGKPVEEVGPIVDEIDKRVQGVAGRAGPGRPPRNPTSLSL